MKITLAFTSALVLLSGCASISMLPQSVNETDFTGREGKTGWSKYEHIEDFNGYTIEQVYAAAKVGLGNAGFALRRADLSLGMAVGEHGMTPHDWNIIAGVYFKETHSGVKVKVIAEGSKDIGFSGDATSDGWTGRILKEMRAYLNDTHQAILKVDKKDLKER